ncbi:MAG TPA: acyltransferase, partial [Vibrio sp.]|nr:acyltransferase [Vibrio sp.]
QDFDTPEALAQEIDRQIHDNYKLFPVNLLAAEKEDESITAAVKQEFEDKLSGLPQGARQYLIDSYANPVKNIG